MKRVLAIRTADRDFGELLAKNFNKSPDSFFQTYVFSEAEAFYEFAKSNIINVLLYDENLAEPDTDDLRAELVIYLTELSIAGEGGTPSIFKYQASEDIMKEIMVYYNSLLTPAVTGAKQELLIKKVCCVCSPVGGVFSSTLALALASHYSESSKTVFISFDPFFTLPHQEKNPKDRDLTDVLFYAENQWVNRQKMGDFINSCTIKRGNLEILSGVTHWFDICDMSPGITHSIIEGVCNTGLYQNAVFDVGIFGASSMEILLASDVIYVPVIESPLSRKKINEWKRQIRYSANEALLDKVKELHMPSDEGLKGEYDYPDLLSGTLGRFISYNNL